MKVVQNTLTLLTISESGNESDVSVCTSRVSAVCYSPVAES